VYVNEGILIDENEVRIWAIVSLIQISASNYIIKCTFASKIIKS